MKQPKKPTRDQKELMTKRGLKANNWMVVVETKTELEVISKISGKRRKLEK